MYRPVAKLCKGVLQVVRTPVLRQIDAYALTCVFFPQFLSFTVATVLELGGVASMVVTPGYGA
jgi:hypothetical protein